jgi:hypothetical protein
MKIVFPERVESEAEIDLALSESGCHDEQSLHVKTRGGIF